MAIYLEIPQLPAQFPFRTLLNDGDILTTPHWHKELEIIYVKKGVLHIGIGEETIEANEGDFVLVASGRIHYVLASAQSVRYVYQFDEKLFYDLMQDQYALYSLRDLWKEYPAHSLLWKQELAQQVRGYLDAIYEESQQHPYAYMFAVKGYLCLMILEMYRNIAYFPNAQREEYQVETTPVLEKLDHIFRYVEEHYAQAITLEDVASEIGFSTFYFTRFFKRNVGKTFLQFLNEYRIDKAKWILINEDIKTTEMIERIGMGSTKTYFRIFKDITGLTPKAFKVKYHQKKQCS